MAELPFVEKYRPESLDDLAGDHAVKALKAFVRTGNFPLAMIFYGPYGTGKTSAAKAMVRDYYVSRGLYLPSATFRDIRSATKLTPEYAERGGIFSPVLYVDASVTRDIETIRSLVQEFMKIFAPGGVVKFVIFDEADRLSYDAQRALRALLEKYPNTRTVYTTNELGKIDEAIQDRASGGTFEFKYPSVQEVANYLKRLSDREGVDLAPDLYVRIATESTSIREAVGKLGTEVAIVKAEKMPTAIPTAIPTPVLAPARETGPGPEPIREEEEEEVEWERFLKDYTWPEEKEVWMKLLVDGGMEADEKGEPKKKPPEFIVMATTVEVFDKAGRDWQAEMWSRLLSGSFGVEPMKGFLEEGETTYDLYEDSLMTWGQNPDSIKDALEENPPPFNKMGVFRIRWKPEDVSWTESARQAWDIYHHEYKPEDLRPMTLKELEVILIVKNISAPVRGKEKPLDVYKEELIDAIVGAAAVKAFERKEVATPLEELVEEAVSELESVGEAALKELEEL